ncbi:hypothetical protein SUDANB19_02443 [Streptomyces sp. enrichment culture]
MARASSPEGAGHGSFRPQPPGPRAPGQTRGVPATTVPPRAPVVYVSAGALCAADVIGQSAGRRVQLLVAGQPVRLRAQRIQ